MPLTAKQQDAINFPRSKRQPFLRFYWHAKRYVSKKVIEAKLPHLSNKLVGFTCAMPIVSAT